MEQTPDFFRLMQLAGSPAGQKLISLLQKEGGSSLQKAIAQASSGQYELAKQTLSVLLNTPEAQKLLRQLEDQHE